VFFGYFILLHADLGECENMDAVNRVQEWRKLLVVCIYLRKNEAQHYICNSKPRVKRGKNGRCAAHSPSGREIITRGRAKRKNEDDVERA